MILSFSTKFPNGKPTYFIDKIWDGFIKDSCLNNTIYQRYAKLYFEKFGKRWDFQTVSKPKRHTIRKDEHNRWKPGMKIHFTVFPRSKKMFQFAPALECKSVQKVEIFKRDGLRFIRIDGRFINSNQVAEEIAKNDGFDSVDDFFDWFNTDFEGKIIHWTDLKY
jgi:hypothetical protein